MRNGNDGNVSVASYETEDNDEEKEEKTKPRSIFHQFFAPGSLDTSVSSDGEDDQSQGSHSSHSSLSKSSEDTGESSCSSTAQRFDRDLRAKHRDACKHMTNGKFSKAIKTFEGILADLLDRYGEEHHRVGAALHNVAVANLRAGQLNDARDAIEEAVRIRELTLGDKHAKVADSMVEYGIILLSMKKFEESLDMFKKALKLREREAKNARTKESSKEATLKIAKIRHNLGCVNFELGHLDEADAAYTEAINQQKVAFGWSGPFMMMLDTTKPGFLTMASTMCNKGYIALEQARYTDAIKIFYESLKIQKSLLQPNNKLCLSTLDNIGFAYCMLSDIVKAKTIYCDLVDLQKDPSMDQNQRGWAASLKKVIYCQIRLHEFEAAFDNLRLLEEWLATKGQHMRRAAEDLEKTHELLSEVNYQIFRFPTLADYTGRFGLCTGDGAELVDAEDWFPKKPANGSKMSGHRMTYA